jgi:hypothetical protein
MMKKAILMIMTLGVVFIVFSQEKTVYGKVQIIDGKEVYILNEPTRNYEAVGEVKTGLKIGSVLTRGIWNEDINAKSAQFTRKAIRKLSKDGQEFDAILYSEKKRVKAIKFTEEVPASEKQLATINSYYGVHVYVLAQPVDDYDVVNSVRGNVKFLPFLTYGFVNNSIEKDAKSFAKKVSKKHTLRKGEI